MGRSESVIRLRVGIPTHYHSSNDGRGDFDFSADSALPLSSVPFPQENVRRKRTGFRLRLYVPLRCPHSLTHSLTHSLIPLSVLFPQLTLSSIQPTKYLYLILPLAILSRVICPSLSPPTTRRGWRARRRGLFLSDQSRMTRILELSDGRM